MTILANDELQAIRARCEAAIPISLLNIFDAQILKIDRDALIESIFDIPALLAHIEAQCNALAKAEADKAVLVEAIKVMCRNALEMGYCNEIDCSKCDSRTALARVKGGSMSDGNSYPWADKSYCPGLGCWEDCYQTSECAHQKDCAESDKDTRRNYCPACGKLNEECVCKESPCPKN